MNCNKIRRLIQDVVDGAASGADRTAVEEHTARCAACARELEQSRLLVNMLSTPPARRVSEDFEHNLMRAIRQAEPAGVTASWWERFRLRFEWKLRVPALVAAGSLASALVATVILPQAIQSYQDHATQVREQHRLADSVTQRHQQLQRADPHANWEAVEASIELSTGSITSGNL